MSNETNKTNPTETTDTTSTPAQRTEAQRLLADMLSWGQILRDAVPPLYGFLIFSSPEQRIASHAWGQFQAAAKKLENLLTSDLDGQEKGEVNA